MATIESSLRQERVFTPETYAGLLPETIERVNGLRKVAIEGKGFRETPTNPEVNTGQLDERFPEQFRGSFDGENLFVQVGNKDQSKREKININGVDKDVIFSFWQTNPGEKTAVRYVITSDNTIMQKDFDGFITTQEKDGKKVDSWSNSQGKGYSVSTSPKAIRAHMKLAMAGANLDLGKLI
jgi:hypothetical protein